MNSKIKVLMVLGNTGRGGAQTFAMNVLRMINRDRYQVDFAVNEIRENGYTQEIFDLGSKIYLVPFFKGYNVFSYVKTWAELLTKNKYDIVHGHVSSSASIYLKIAHKCGCKTIVHSHSAGYRGSKIEVLIKKVFTIGAKGQADYWFACSKPAAERLFGYDYNSYKHYFYIPNAIITDNYLYNLMSRELIRHKLGIQNNQRLYGHVGSFTSPKNHDFLLEIFAGILKKEPQAMLVLAGEGEREIEIKSKIESLNIENRVLLVGNVGNVNEYMMAMDAMIFPSFFEGFPITILEAQATGLPIILSDTITQEVFLTSCVHPLSLREKIEIWIDECINAKCENRKEMNDTISRSQYNMRNCAIKLMDIYEEMIQQDSSEAN